MNPKTSRLRFPLALAIGPLLALASMPDALAQEPGAGPAEGGPPAGPAVTVVQVPAPPTQTQTVYGPLPPQGWDPNGHLPQSSRATTDINAGGDGFDFGSKATGPVTVHGSDHGSYVNGGSFLPEGHTVRRGDTLWDISGHYYQNPYEWPRVWAQNPQIQNPHWIYPGDRVRLREPGVRPGSGALGFSRRRPSVPPQTIFLRDYGWVDDKDDDNWGEIVASPDDVMMLNEGQEIYVQLGEGHDIAIGQLLTVFRPVKTVASKNAKGQLISIRGTARIDRFNPRTRMVRAKIIESLDVIERGARVGPVTRRFEVVPPVKSDVDLDAHILAAVYPYQFYGQNQVVFIDRGEKDGVRPGQRFFAVRRGDRWEDNLQIVGQMALLRARIEDDLPARVDPLLHETDETLLPDETYAELRVIKAREHTATAIVVASKYEIESNAVLVARKGL